MTPTPGPPYEWDENKRRETLNQRGLDFALAYQIDWTGATHRTQERGGETRFASLRQVDNRFIPHSLDSERPVHQNNQPEKGQQQGDCTI